MSDNKREIIGGKRVCGKTTELIVRSYNTGAYILCANKIMARITYEYAIELGKHIPYPITPSDLPLSGGVREVIVDEVELVLRELTGLNITTMSTSNKLNEMNSLSNRDKKEPLLKIQIQDEESVPEVKHKGSQVDMKKNVAFNWVTSGLDEPAILTYAIENYQEDGTLNRIEKT